MKQSRSSTDLTPSEGGPPGVQDDAQLGTQINEKSPADADGGKAAWLFLAACYVIEAVTFGFGFSFGVLQDYYSSHAPFQGSSSIPAIGTTTTGLMYLGTPFVLTFCRTFPRIARWLSLAGVLLCAISLASSSFANSAPQLIGVQGVLYGLGGCIAYCPCTIYIDQWFVRRKGMAYGIVWSAAGTGGVVFPFVLQALLDAKGFRNTMRILSGVIFAISAPLTLFIRPRVPLSLPRSESRSVADSDGSEESAGKRFSMRFAVSRRFIIHQTANVIEAAGYFLPSIYLPTYARELFAASSFRSALTSTLVNLSATVGLVLMGLISDRLKVTHCMLISASGTAVAVLIIWGLTPSLAVLYVFCIVYGLFAGCWASIWPGIMREVAGKAEAEGYGRTDPVMVQGHLCIGRGVGNIVSGPLSNALVGIRAWRGQARGGYGSGYGALIVFTGLTAFVSGLNFIWEFLGVI
ncbi:major facilitator superfamily domain-containing protein [Nemania sp. FL0916]|nr:major facilitator superfamily domain-containing protein [Nemania sp. FL0916]